MIKTKKFWFVVDTFLKTSMCIAIMLNVFLNREHLIMEDYLKIEKIGEGELMFLFVIYFSSITHISVTDKVQV